MATRVPDRLFTAFEELRYEPVALRGRAELGGATAVDSTRALVVRGPARRAAVRRPRAGRARAARPRRARRR